MSSSRRDMDRTSIPAGGERSAPRSRRQASTVLYLRRPRTASPDPEGKRKKSKIIHRKLGNTPSGSHSVCRSCVRYDNVPDDTSARSRLSSPFVRRSNMSSKAEERGMNHRLEEEERARRDGHTDSESTGKTDERREKETR
ncbi:hypothetical protein EYF80_010843 [Liparis tanakae]|uniref:Uncharacterized protein n=1 Tax=Liparis tanakae TaxID=230148 RepID=A0A4Z2IMC4_9TELE|nr:hypothetical protein EYF80_010843 [Liparis tanakae]